MTFLHTLKVLTAIRDARSPRGRECQQRFRRAVRSYYGQCARSFLWRETRDPYRILVSEVMLQQTQTARVVERFPRFLRQFPDITALANASQSEVVRAWEGLGYYRRAQNLHRAAQAIVQYHGGVVPRSCETLRSLPGVGEYTAAAVSTFAFGRGVAMIETNIRSLYLYVFFKGKRMVSDREVLRLVHATMPSRNVREWFYALMDLGVELKKSAPAINHASRHHTRQSSFQGSDRQVAAHVLRVVVTAKTALTRARVAQAVTETLTAATSRQIDRALARLVREGLIVQTARGSVRVA